MQCIQLIRLKLLILINLYAFTWEGQQYTWTAMAQGFTESSRKF